MSLKIRGRDLFIVLITAVVVFVVAWIFIRRGGEAEKEGGEEEEEEAVATPSRVSVQAGERVITLTRDLLAKNGIEVSALPASTHRAELPAFGTVIAPHELSAARSRQAAAAAGLDETRAALAASQKEYARLAALFEKNRNVSEKEVQAAEAAWRSDEAAASAAAVAAAAAKSDVRLEWGAELAAWLSEGTPAFRRLEAQQDVLIQLTLPPGTGLPSPPATACLPGPAGCAATARLVSSAPRTDPRVQGPSFFFVASAAESGLQPGMNLTAFLPVGQEVQGMVIPAAAVVWLGGKTWVFIEKTPGNFVRREIPAASPVAGGWFVPKEQVPGPRIVTTGAQYLLSEEFRSQIEIEG